MTKRDGKLVLNVLLQVCVFRADRKSKMVALASDFAEIFFDFSATTEWIWTKFDRKQVLNVLYQVRVFRANRKSKMAALASDGLKRHFSTSPQPLNEF